MTKDNKSKFIVEYSTKDIMNKLDIIDNKLSCVGERASTNRKLVYGAYGFCGTLLGIMITILIMG